MPERKIALNARVFAVLLVLAALLWLGWMSWRMLSLAAQFEIDASVGPVTELNEDKEEGAGVKRSSAPNAEAGPAIRINQQLSRLRNRVAQLEEYNLRHRRLIQSLLMGQPSIEPPDVDDIIVAEAKAEQARLENQEAQQIEERNRTIEAEFDVQRVDPGWSVNVSRELTESLANTGMDGIYLTDLECRSSLCRLELEFTKPHARAEFEGILPRLTTNAVPGISMKSDVDEDGIFTIIYYMKRIADIGT